MSGYDIKDRVDRSTRFFWATSYGQIYPELRRLSEAGLIEGEADARGRAPPHFLSLTPAGREALEGWLAGCGARSRRCATRALLKVSSSPPAAPGHAVAALEAKRGYHGRTLRELREIEAAVHRQGSAGLTRCATASHSTSSIADWCDREAERRDRKRRDDRASRTPRRSPRARAS